MVVSERLIQIVNQTAQENGVEIEKTITPEDNIVDSLNFDSIMLVQLVIEIEDEFNIEIDDELIEQDLFDSVENLEKFILEKL